MWKGSGRSLFRTLILENFKFTLFVVTPVVTASIFWYEPFVEKIVRDRNYVNYPPEGLRPPTNEEDLQQMREERLALARARRAKAATKANASGDASG